MSQLSITDSHQLLERLARINTDTKSELSTVIAVGGQAVVWPVKIKSHISYNVYNVCAVVIGQAGTVPVEIGQQVQAVNLAESFLNQGSLSLGSYAIMFKAGEKNIFYCVP